MKNKQHQLGFTIVELLVVISIIALLVGILVPAVQKARETAQVTQSKSNIHQLMISLQTYASDHNDRNFTTAPDNLSSGDRQGLNISNAIAQLSGNLAYPLGVGLGSYGDDTGGVIYFISIDSWYGHETGGVAPYCFSSGLTTSTNGKTGYGVWRYPNALQVAEYMEGDTLHSAYFAPKDEVVLKSIEDCADMTGSYCPTTEMIGATAPIKSNMVAIPSSYTMAPGMMYHPAVYQWSLQAGQFPTDPMNLPRGFKPPSIDQTRYPSHKTWLMEHHWLQNNSGNDCGRRFTGTWFLDGDGCYDGCEPTHFNAHPDSEPVTVFADGSAKTYSVNDFIIDSERSTQNNAPGDQTGLWLPSSNMAQYGFDNGAGEYFADSTSEIQSGGNPVKWSGHTHTKFGVKGRDKVAR